MARTGGYSNIHMLEKVLAARTATQVHWAGSARGTRQRRKDHERHGRAIARTVECRRGVSPFSTVRRGRCARRCPGRRLYCPRARHVLGAAAVMLDGRLSELIGTSRAKRWQIGCSGNERGGLQCDHQHACTDTLTGSGGSEPPKVSGDSTYAWPAGVAAARTSERVDPDPEVDIAVIVVVDGPDDSDMMNGFSRTMSDTRLRIIVNPRSLTAAGARNEGVEQANGGVDRAA